MARTFDVDAACRRSIRRTRSSSATSARARSISTRCSPQSDFVVVCCLLNDETRHLIGAPQFARMKPTPTSSTSRADRSSTRPALIDALRAGRIAGRGARRVRAGAGRSGQSAAGDGQRDRHAAFAVLDRRVLSQHGDAPDSTSIVDALAGRRPSSSSIRDVLEHPRGRAWLTDVALGRAMRVARGRAGRRRLSAARRPAFDLQGHRGARGLAPENTLAAFRARAGDRRHDARDRSRRDARRRARHLARSVASIPICVRGPDGRWLAAKGPRDPHR